jgi:hypothetical protein
MAIARQHRPADRAQTLSMLASYLYRIDAWSLCMCDFNRICQGGQNELQKADHPISLRDSLSSSIG